MDLKKPLTFDEQLDKLAAHGMIITDREKAKVILKRVNYYRFTGYALQFRQDPSGSDYIVGTTFETVYHLYKVDEILRDTFRRYIEKAEVYYRTQIAYGFSIAKCTETPYDQHYDENNFYNKKGYREVIENFSREKNYNTDFNPPAKFTTTFLRKHPEIKNNSLFAYALVLLKRLPDESSKKSLI